MKNLCGKMIPIKDLDKAYEVWESRDGTWRWYCLKKWQADDNKPFARWFCAVSSPFTHGGYDYGDTYVSDIVIKANAKRIK